MILNARMGLNQKEQDDKFILFCVIVAHKQTAIANDDRFLRAGKATFFCKSSSAWLCFKLSCPRIFVSSSFKKSVKVLE